jgi:DNA-binding NarL/FixJ family response regulator
MAQSRVPNQMILAEPLTRRELEMAHAVARGLRNRQIAREYGISEETVKKHLATIYGKLALNGRVALAVHVLQGALHGAGLDRRDDAPGELGLVAGVPAPDHDQIVVR